MARPPHGADNAVGREPWYDQGMQQVTLEQATARLGDLVDAALRGEEVILDGNGRGAVRLVPVASSVNRPQFGSDKGSIEVPDDFDAPLDCFGI